MKKLLIALLFVASVAHSQLNLGVIASGRRQGSPNTPAVNSGYLATYYISNSGLYANNGLTPQTPWPLGKVLNGVSYGNNVRFLFNRGETFTGTVYTGGNKQSNAAAMSYDAYGSGANPIITTMKNFPGWTTPGNWRQVAGLTNVWATKINPLFNYTPRVWLNGSEYQRAKDSTQVNATTRTCFRNADFEWEYVYSVGNPTTYYTSMTTTSGSTNAMLVSGQYNVNIRNLDIRGAEGASLDIEFCSNVLIENTSIGVDGVREGIRVNTINGLTVRNNVIETGEKFNQTFNISSEGGDGILLGQGNTSNVDIYNNTIKNWRHTGWLVEQDDSTKTLANIHIHNNLVDVKGVEYGHGFGAYFYKGTNVVFDYDTIKNQPTVTQLAANGLVVDHVIIDSTRNGPNSDMGQTALFLGHAYFPARNMTISNSTFSNNASGGIELNGSLAHDSSYADVINNRITGNTFINNGWNTKIAYGDTALFRTNTDISIRRDPNVKGNTYTNNYFSRQPGDLAIYNGHDTTGGYLKTVAQFNAANGKAGDVITGNTSIQPPVVQNQNTFTLASTASTSAGVYKNDGTDDILIRTLWSGDKKTAGTYPIYWDGKDDAGTLVADGNYKVKVLSNNVSYNWDGVIGNTSDSLTGSTVRNESEGMIYGMAINGNYAYYANGYHERQPTYFKFNTATPNQRITIDPQTTGKAVHVATDGTNVYWSVAGTNNDYFIVATKVIDDSYVTFPNGVTKDIYLGGTYSSAIGVTNVATIDGLAGLAVQKNGNYLFQSDKLNGKLQVINKTTGALAQTLSIPNAGRMAVDASDNLWMITGTTVAKYPVNSNGTLGTATTTLSGLVAPLALAVSPGGTNISVCDGGTSQQVKTFNNSTGALISTLGLAGGYSNGPDVTTNKFYFANTKRLAGGSDSDSHPFTFISYAPDGSFWVGDIGNYRALHYSSSNTFIEQTMNTGFHYSANVDANNPNRVFSNYLEFNVDYTKPLAPNNGSWTLVKNWAYNVPGSKDDQFSRLRSVATLSNGRTYAVAQSGGSSEIVELTSTGLRFTGVTTNGYLEKSGNITNPNPASQLVGSSAVWTTQPLLNFDASGNPVYGAATTIGTTPTLTGKDPVDQNNGSSRVLSNGNIVTFNDANYSDNVTGNGYHLGILKNNKWLSKFSSSTYRGYEGDFPPNGDFDIGNSVGYAANYMQSIENSIFYIYHGEFYKSSQTNKINHFYSDGLFLGQAGVVGADVNGNAPAMMAGNAKVGTVVKVGSDYYLYHGDESFHGGTHRWKISGLNTINEQTIAVTKPGVPAPPAIDYIDLMAGLPYASSLVNNTNGWTRNPATDYNNSFSDNWQVLTNKTTYKTSDRDVKIANYPVTGGLLREVDRDLGNNTNLTNWTISGQVAYTEPQENSGYNYMDVLDAAGKVIVRISRLDSSSNFTLLVNGTKLVNAANTSANGFYKLQPLSIKISGSTVTVNYSTYSVTAAKFDSTADVTSPKTLRFQSSSPNNASHVIDVARLRFYNNTVMP